MHFIVTNNNKLGYHFCHCIQLLLFFDYLKHVKVTNMQEIRNQIGGNSFFFTALYEVLAETEHWQSL